MPVVAMKEKPPFRAWTDACEIWYGAIADGGGSVLESARNASVIKVENDVKLPQKPVASPIYSGIVFFALSISDTRSFSLSFTSTV